MTQLPDTLAARLEAVRETIVAACARANRPADSVTLVAVSKTHPPDALLEAIACGQTHFGENRIEEGADKITAVKARSSVPLTWHMIGHVQSRKARDVIATFDYVHSMDSLKLAERYSRFAVEVGRAVPVLLEMNVSGEDSKSGFSAEHWHNDSNQRESLWNDIRRIIELPGIVVRGLMTMAPIVEQPEAARPTFSALRELRNKLAADFSTADWSALSMGMTDDYAIAIEEGATIVRVGRAIFGPREMV
jgi:pyridoxal phosphate enzyme (YggS family)